MIYRSHPNRDDSLKVQPGPHERTKDGTCHDIDGHRIGDQTQTAGTEPAGSGIVHGGDRSQGRRSTAGVAEHDQQMGGRPGRSAVAGMGR